MSLVFPITRCQWRALGRLKDVQRGAQVSRMATSSLSSRRSSPKPLLGAKVRETFAKVRFTEADVPPMSYFQQAVRPPLFDNSSPSPDDLFSSITAYASIALQDAPSWRQNIAQGPDALSLPTLHYAAISIITGPGSPAWNVALNILETLIGLNYVPSILTMVRLGFRIRKLGDLQFRSAEQAFARLLKASPDPDACTLQGLILASQLTPETDAEALEWFRRAARLGGEERGAWEWQASCALEMGRIYLRAGERDRAREIFKYAASELDLAEGCWLYATLLEDDKEREGWVLKAAISNNDEAAQEMARIEGAKGENATGWEGQLREVLSDEWDRIAEYKGVIR